MSGTYKTEDAVRLLHKLWAVCKDDNGELWARGIAVIERKCNARIWLSEFVPSDMQEGDAVCKLEVE